ncbi:hypothetical protein I553_5519 [Mycobacterium xenopi 4042]|uniref:Uncharacterized protein n=1 Tax=Mycobacterium xenopi 4042 TaxID=1299334 RepID=X7ZTX9_MYCXE|nr:hypothetical protein I553_5519 [Mycobacterium xenopi 4042]
MTRAEGAPAYNLGLDGRVVLVTGGVRGSAPASARCSPSRVRRW